MGEARLRGTYEERKTAAAARDNAIALSSGKEVACLRE